MLPSALMMAAQRNADSTDQPGFRLVNLLQTIQRQICSQPNKNNRIHYIIPFRLLLRHLNLYL